MRNTRLLTRGVLPLVAGVAAAVAVVPALASSGSGASVAPRAVQPFSFSTGSPDGQAAMASRPLSTGKVEIDAADDFGVPAEATITGATFTGLLVPSTTPLSSIQDVRVKIYRVFPLDSTNPPSGQVLTRSNSPSDTQFALRDAGAGDLTFDAAVLSPSFSASNSVTNGIFPRPNQLTGGEGPVTGTEVQVTVTFDKPLDLPADHYFFVPQVQLSSGDFYWLSAPGPGSSTTDLQTWIRNPNIAPDWSRVGTDIIGGGKKFNASFSLSGTLTPPPLITTITTTVTTTTTVVSTVALPPPPRPRLAKLRINPFAFTAEHGATVSFALNQAAKVNVTFEQRLNGRRGRHGVCEAPSLSNRNGRICTRIVKAPDALTLSGNAGNNSFHIAPQDLIPGHYFLFATPAGGTGTDTRFQMLPSRKRKL
jgi:hypothetical protein